MSEATLETAVALTRTVTVPVAGLDATCSVLAFGAETTCPPLTVTA